MKQLAYAALVALSLLSWSAFAQSDAPDEVTLKSGGFIRGTVVSSEPGVGVRILELGGTEPRLVPWADVADVARGKYAAPVAPPAPSSSPAPPAPPSPPALSPDAPGLVRLHIESPEPLRVYRREYVASARAHRAEVSFYRHVALCLSPCDRVLDDRGESEILIEGERVAQAELSLDDKQGDYELRVVPGSPEGRTFGAITAAVGGLALLIAGPLFVAGELNHVRSSDQTGPAVGAVAGGVLLVGGFVVWGFSGDDLDLHPRFGSSPSP
jgi:hypothetical protein